MEYIMIVKRKDDVLIELSGRKNDDGTIDFYIDLGVTRRGFTYDRNGNRVLNPTYGLRLQEDIIPELRIFLNEFTEKDLQEAKNKLMKELKTA